MIHASALFNAVAPFSEGTDSSSANAGAGSAAAAFAALLAELDPADLQAALGAPVASANGAPIEETAGTLPEAGDAAAPLAPIPVLLDVRSTGPSRAPEQKLPPAIGAEEEEEKDTSTQESLVDPLAFLLAPTMSPIVDRVPLVPLSIGAASALPEETQTETEAVLPLNESDADVPTEAALSVAATEIGAAPSEVQAPEAPPQTPAFAPLPKTTESVPARESAEPPQRSRDTRTDSVARPPIDLRQALGETPRAARTTESLPSERPAPDVDGQQDIPRESEAVNPSNVDARWVQAVKRFVAQTATAAETPADTRNTYAPAGERNPQMESVRFAVRSEERLASLARPEPQSGNPDHQSQRGTAGSLAPHGPQFASSAASSVEFALPSVAATTEDAPLPEDGDLARQIVQAAHLQWRNGGGEARLTLQPEYLGEVQISIRVEAGTVTATMRAAEPEVRAWMQSHESLLKQGLAEQGLRLDKLNVHDERDEREPGQDRREPRDQPYRPQPPRGTPPVFELTV